MMNGNSIAQSYPINISKENKIEIVKTLKTYPLVLDELYITNDLLDKCNEIVVVQETQINIKDTQIDNLQSQITNLNNQTKLFASQLKRVRGSRLRVMAIAGASIIGIVLIK